MDLKQILKMAFPLMPEEKINAISTALETKLHNQNLAVEDLQHTEPSDFVPILETFQSRKLINIMKEITSEKTNNIVANIASASETTSDSECIINWSRVPKKFINMFENKKRPTSAERKSVIPYFVDDILEQTVKPGRKVLARYAEYIVSKYPDSFCDKMSKDGTVIGNGSYSLLMQLENRVANLKRKKPVEEISEANVDDPTPSKKADEYGCVNWQPSVPDGESLDALEELRQQLLVIHSKGKANWKENQISPLMLKTYYLQRVDINNGLPLTQIKERWPFFTCAKYMNDHFQYLTSKCAVTSIKLFLSSDAEKLIKFFTSLGKAVKQCLLIEKKLKVASECMPEGHVKLIGVIEMLAASLKEKGESIFFKIEEDVDEKSLSDLDLPTTPCLMFKGESAFMAREFFLLIDGVMFGCCTDVVSAVAAMFGTYFVFNIKYSKDVPVTLEFIQRVIMKINPEKGTKLAKKKGNRQWSLSPSLLSLTNSIREFEQIYDA